MLSQILLPGSPRRLARGSVLGSQPESSYRRLGSYPPQAQFILCSHAEGGGLLGTLVTHSPHPLRTRSEWIRVIICWQILPTSLQGKPWHLWSWLCLSPHCWVPAEILHFEVLKELCKVEGTREEAVTQDTLVVLFGPVHPVPRDSRILNR